MPDLVGWIRTRKVTLVSKQSKLYGKRFVYKIEEDFVTGYTGSN